jgi:menaquinone-dependent protoporphyrinogen oxidase
VDTTSALVAYASTYGSTRGIAERLAGRLRAHGVRVDLRPVEAVGSVERYDAVVFGSPVFDQAWMPAGEEFVRLNAGELAARPVWLFSVGSFGDGKHVIGPLMRREPRGIARILETVRPRGYRVFAGVIDRHQWPFLSRLFYYALGGRLGDNRDWPEIEAWADEIARALTASQVSQRCRRPGAARLARAAGFAGCAQSADQAACPASGPTGETGFPRYRRSLFDSMSNHMAKSVNCEPAISSSATSTTVAGVMFSPRPRRTATAMPRPRPTAVMRKPRK